MKRLQTIIAKTVLFAAAGIGLSACVAVAPEPVYYSAPAYYGYHREYYAPRPAYGGYFVYESRGHGRHRGHR